MKETLSYYSTDGRHIMFHDFTIDYIGIVRDINDNVITPLLNGNGYEIVSVSKDSKRYQIRVARAVASTFFGPPPTLKHTADHDNGKRTDNSLDNIYWKTPTEQSKNRTLPDTHNDAFIIVKDGIEKTAKEWVMFLGGENTPFGNVYTYSVIVKYAQRKRFGFSYKIFADLPGERWEVVLNSSNRKGHWEISNKNRVKYVTKFASNVLNVTQLGLSNGYPMITINGKHYPTHHLCIQTFSPYDYEKKTNCDIIRHKKDDRLDFRPEHLMVGTRTQNMFDAHDNGKFIGTKTARKICVSYIDGIKEKTHDSLSDAVRYLKENGWSKARVSNISRVVESNKTMYKRVWKHI
jgi:hypothetical protein